MTNLINTNIQTMSSKEIAELTGKEHKNILRDIRNMVEDLGCSNLSNEQYQEVKDNRGYTAEFLLDKELSIILVSGYSVQMRAKIVRRWLELEEHDKVIQQPIVQNTSVEIQRLEFDLEKDKQEFYLKLERDRKQMEIDMDLLRKQNEEKLKVYQYRSNTALMKLEEQKKKHITKMEVLENDRTRILAKREIKVRADATVSKEHLPHDTITNLLKKFNIHIEAFEFNNLLIKHGYLMPNRKTVTQKGTFFGHTVKASTTAKQTYPRWYESEFSTLIEELVELEPEVFKI